MFGGKRKGGECQTSGFGMKRQQKIGKEEVNKACGVRKYREGGTRKNERNN